MKLFTKSSCSEMNSPDTCGQMNFLERFLSGNFLATLSVQNSLDRLQAVGFRTLAHRCTRKRQHFSAHIHSASYDTPASVRRSYSGNGSVTLFDSRFVCMKSLKCLEDRCVCETNCCAGLGRGSLCAGNISKATAENFKVFETKSYQQ